MAGLTEDVRRFLTNTELPHLTPEILPVRDVFADSVGVVSVVQNLASQQKQPQSRLTPDLEQVPGIHAVHSW
ncbi:MAG: hypothetical protein E5Y02_00995 [Mesorhizobium sp.]|nr:MAG: hypothetical protein E5Y02_00995 [Mesorhizobium sp.]